MNTNSLIYSILEPLIVELSSSLQLLYQKKKKSISLDFILLFGSSCKYYMLTQKKLYYSQLGMKGKIVLSNETNKNIKSYYEREHRAIRVIQFFFIFTPPPELPNLPKQKTRFSANGYFKASKNHYFSIFTYKKIQPLQLSFSHPNPKNFRHLQNHEEAKNHCNIQQQHEQQQSSVPFSLRGNHIHNPRLS